MSNVTVRSVLRCSLISSGSCCQQQQQKQQHKYERHYLMCVSLAFYRMFTFISFHFFLLFCFPFHENNNLLLVLPSTCYYARRTYYTVAFFSCVVCYCVWFCLYFSRFRLIRCTRTEWNAEVGFYCYALVVHCSLFIFKQSRSCCFLFPFCLLLFILSFSSGFSIIL